MHTEEAIFKTPKVRVVVDETVEGLQVDPCTEKQLDLASDSQPITSGEAPGREDRYLERGTAARRGDSG